MELFAMTELQIKKQGNSSAIRFSKELLRQVGFENNSLIGSVAKFSKKSILV